MDQLEAIRILANVCAEDSSILTEVLKLAKCLHKLPSNSREAVIQAFATLRSVKPQHLNDHILAVVRYRNEGSGTSNSGWSNFSTNSRTEHIRDNPLGGPDTEAGPSSRPVRTREPASVNLSERRSPSQTRCPFCHKSYHSAHTNRIQGLRQHLKAEVKYWSASFYHSHPPADVLRWACGLCVGAAPAKRIDSLVQHIEDTHCAATWSQLRGWDFSRCMHNLLLDPSLKEHYTRLLRDSMELYGAKWLIWDVSTETIEVFSALQSRGTWRDANEPMIWAKKARDLAKYMVLPISSSTPQFHTPGLSVAVPYSEPSYAPQPPYRIPHGLTTPQSLPGSEHQWGSSLFNDFSVPTSAIVTYEGDFRDTEVTNAANTCSINSSIADGSFADMSSESSSSQQEFLSWPPSISRESSPFEEVLVSSLPPRSASVPPQNHRVQKSFSPLSAQSDVFPDGECFEDDDNPALLHACHRFQSSFLVQPSPKTTCMEEANALKQWKCAKPSYSLANIKEGPELEESTLKQIPPHFLRKQRTCSDIRSKNPFCPPTNQHAGVECQLRKSTHSPDLIQEEKARAKSEFRRSLREEKILDEKTKVALTAEKSRKGKNRQALRGLKHWLDHCVD